MKMKCSKPEMLKMFKSLNW